LNREAATVVNGQVLYLCPDGTVLLEGASARLETFVWSRETWRDFTEAYRTGGGVPKLVAYGHRALIYLDDPEWRDNELLGAEDGPPMGGLIFDTADNAWSYFTGPINYAFQVPAGSFGVHPDVLAFSPPGETAWWVFAGEQGQTRNWIWHSKDFVLKKPVNLGAIQIFGTGVVTVEVFADAVLRHTRSIELSTSGVVIRLPSGFLATTWSFKMTASANLTEVTEFNAAVSVREFQGA
jgi:hypothetical protein